MVWSVGESKQLNSRNCRITTTFFSNIQKFISGEKKTKKEKKTHTDTNNNYFSKLTTWQDGDVPASFGLYNFIMSMYSSYNKKKISYFL